MSEELYKYICTACGEADNCNAGCEYGCYSGVPVDNISCPLTREDAEWRIDTRPEPEPSEEPKKPLSAVQRRERVYEIVGAKKSTRPEPQAVEATEQSELIEALDEVEKMLGRERTCHDDCMCDICIAKQQTWEAQEAAKVLIAENDTLRETIKNMELISAIPVKVAEATKWTSIVRGKLLLRNLHFREGWEGRTLTSALNAIETLTDENKAQGEELKELRDEAENDMIKMADQLKAAQERVEELEVILESFGQAIDPKYSRNPTLNPPKGDDNGKG